MSLDEPDVTRVLAAAERLRDQVVDDPLARAAPLDRPLPVRSPAGDLDSWFVPLVAEGVLLGFLQLEPDLRLHRYSSLQRTAGSTDGCPPRESWLDPRRIEDRAREAALQGERTLPPFLSYDGNRDRVAWRVPVEGSTAVVYVAGDYVYRVSEERSL